VAATRSRELLILTSAGICFGAAVGTHHLGFSVALGAFIAGLIISESEYSHEVLAEVIPLRDLFASVFFVSIGMMFDPRFLVQEWAPVFVITGAILVGKAAIVAGVVRLFGYHPRIAVYAAVGLAQIGEFSFVMARIGLDRELVTPYFYSLVISTALLTIFATPLLYNLAPWIAGLVASRGDATTTDRTPEGGGAAALRDHVVICGYGRVGAQVGTVLGELGVPFAVADYDHNIIASLSQQGVPAVYGDASRAEVLAHTHPERARVAVVTIPDLFSARLVVRRLRTGNESLPIVARCHAEPEVAILRIEGANEVVLPEYEAGLEVLRYTLLRHSPAAARAQEYVDRVRQERYQAASMEGSVERSHAAAPERATGRWDGRDSDEPVTRR
jgi:CPA2 family monovalent cation:H+ antiporter-2